jgi:MFS family permease
MAVGSLAAALGIAYTGRITRRTLLAGATGFSLLLLFLSISSIWIPTIGILVLLGLFSIVFTATANSRLQMLTPPHLRGRVMSLYTLLFQGSTPIGSLVVGTLASREGVRPAVFELALLCGVGTLAGFAYARRHRSADGDQLPAVAQPAEPVRPVRAVHQAD